MKRDCNITGCLYCKGRGPYGDGCEFICEFVDSSLWPSDLPYTLQTMMAATQLAAFAARNSVVETAANSFVSFEPDPTQPTVSHSAVREKREEQTSSTNCVAHDGHEDCTICTNGVCHTSEYGRLRGEGSGEYH